MTSRPVALLAAAGGLVVAVVLFVVLRDDEGSVTTSDVPLPTAHAPRGENTDGRRATATNGEGDGRLETPTITVKDGQPVGGVAELTFSVGHDVRFAVEADVADQLHLHGYDVSKSIRPGRRVEFDVPASIEGVFELELEESAVPIAEISVVPD